MKNKKEWRNHLVLFSMFFYHITHIAVVQHFLVLGQKSTFTCLEALRFSGSFIYGLRFSSYFFFFISRSFSMSYFLLISVTLFLLLLFFDDCRGIFVSKNKRNCKGKLVNAVQKKLKEKSGLTFLCVHFFLAFC